MQGGEYQHIEADCRHPLTPTEPRHRRRLAIATQGKRINLPGGLPIIVDGIVIGGIGVGSGTGAQDLEVAKSGIAALADAKRFD